MRIVSAILGIALVIAGGAAIQLWRDAGRAQEQIAQLKAQIQGQSAGLPARSATQATQAPASVSIATPENAQASESAPVAVAAQPVPGAVSPDLLAVLKAQMSSPETAARTQALQRSMLVSANPDLREVLGLSADETEKLLDLLAANTASLSALSGSPRDPSISPQERARAMAERSQANEAALQAMLGSKYAQWKEYEEARPAYQQRRDLRAVLNAAGAPLTDAQDKALIAALSAEQRSFNQQTRDALSRGQPYNPMARYTPERRQQLLAAVAPHLSPQQLKSYTGMLERAAQQQAIFAAPQGILPGAAATR